MVQTALTLTDLFEVIESAATVLALIVGGIWTYMIFIRKRERYPRAKVEHQVTRQELPDGRWLLTVIVLVQNASEVLLTIKKGTMRVLQMVPMSDQMRNAIGEGNPLAETIQVWPRLAKLDFVTVHGHNYEIEPGESEAFHFVIPVDRAVDTVAVHSRVLNVAKRYRWQGGKRCVNDIGWNTMTYHRVSVLPCTGELLREEQDDSEEEL